MRSIFQVGALVSLFAASSGTAYGQSPTPAPVPAAVQEPAPTEQPSAKQQPTTASSPSASPQSQAAPIPKAKPAKVWTNDEVNVLKNGPGVSVVGKSAPQNASATSTKVKGYSQEKDPNWYRQQLQPLQAEIDGLNAQIEKTKAFLNGDKVNDQPASTHAYYGVAGNPQDQLEKLEAKRDKDVEKVNDLLDRARHNDIPPGALR
jgi:hypothetical protein